MKALHTICHREGLGYRGLHAIDRKDGLYLSECWSIRDADPESLIGGRLFFHESSYKAAGFAAEIISIAPWPMRKGRAGIAFTVRRLASAGQYWRGRTPSPSRPHGGIVDVKLPG